MELNIMNYCCCCLSADRKMKSINIYTNNKHIFQFLFEITKPLSSTMTSSWDDMNICWECETKINNFLKFKNQIASCFKILTEYAHKKSPFKSKSALQTKDTIYLDYTPNLSKATTSIDNHREIDILDVKDEDPHLYDNGTDEEIGEETNSTIRFDTKQTIKKKRGRRKTKARLNELTVFEEDLPKLSEDVSNATDLNMEPFVTIPPTVCGDVETTVKIEHCSDDEYLVDIRKDKHVKTPIMCKVIKEKWKKGGLWNGRVIYKELVLKQDLIDKERNEMRTQDEYAMAVFKCDDCILPFPNVDDLNDHILIKHKQNSSQYQCSICTCTFSSEPALNYHTRRHQVRYKCTLCPNRSESKIKALRHFEDIHSHSSKSDLQSNQEYNDPHKHRDTLNGLKSDESNPCGVCQKTFRWKSSLRKHMETHVIAAGQKRKPYCETCRMTFINTANLQRHVKTSSKHQIHLNLMKLKDTVPEDNDDPEKIKRDIEKLKSKIVTKKERHICPHCNKKFQWKGNLTRHLNSHVARANGELVCEPCNKTFSSIATYKQHMMISKKHVSENDFKYMCSDCGKRFSTKTKLKDHIDYEHLKKYNHTCPDCQKVFKCHASLYLHSQVVHKKFQNEYLCDLCGKALGNKTKLRIHIAAVHTRESPYKCNFCSARFNWQSCMSRHIKRVHKKSLS